jgi:hypothetical protein
VLDEGQPKKAAYRPVWVILRCQGSALEHIAAESVRQEFEQAFDVIAMAP